LIVAHSVEPVRGAAPFDVVIGNARAVTVSYLGKPVDLAPYTRKNVARLTLK
jgi:cytoskeleton protein RodZ